jgi:hypothetical protein
MKFSLRIISIVLILFLFSSCKDNNNVEPVIPPNNQNANAPVLSSPSNGATVRDFTPVLDWQDFENALGYRIQLSLDANFNGIMVLDSTTTASTMRVPQGKLSTGIYFYWRVIANLQGGGSSDWSAAWRFVVILAPPPAPILVSPTNGAVNVPFSPFFDWNTSPTAQYYRLQVASSASFNNILLDSSGITVTELQSPPAVLITGTQYFWRVNASNSNGLSTGDWSVPFNFTTVNGPIPLSVSGRVTFADTNFIHLPLYYIAGAYISWPPIITGAVEIDTLDIIHTGNIYYADYRLLHLQNISYKIAVGIGEPGQLTNTIMGIYGCDTAHVPFSTCPDNPPNVTIQNYNGIENINFMTWADTSKKIF